MLFFFFGIKVDGRLGPKKQGMVETKKKCSWCWRPVVYKKQNTQAHEECADVQIKVCCRLKIIKWNKNEFRLKEVELKSTN